MTFSPGIRRALLAPAFIALFAGCAVTDNLTGHVSAVAGTYSALVFQVTPAGKAPIDVLAQGGALTIAIDNDNSATGTLDLPASATGGAAFSANMKGTALVAGDGTLHFQQDADTFVRNLKWTVGAGAQQLSVSNQVVSGTTYTIMMIRL
jgi:hypothetical protein